MRLREIKAEKIARVATITTLSFMIIWGLVSVLAEIRPFWVDEWRVIYNLKFKSPAALWGPLDFLQQFPRVYLSIIKAFTSALDYSYFSLRLPSYIVGVITIIFCYRLSGRLYKPGNINRFVLVMTLISCSTFTEYFVQIKQYTMDILLSLVVLWQLLELIALKYRPGIDIPRYIVLCLSFLLCPFFSYTYPVAVAPVFAVILIQNIFLYKQADRSKNKNRILISQWFPLFICTFSITVFYIVDVSQLMKDEGMHDFWGHLLMDHGFSWRSFFINCYMLFAEIGAGVIYWLLFGILGITSFVCGLYNCIIKLSERDISKDSLLLCYSAMLLALVIVLFAAGKLPLGEPRLNAFTIPSVSILMIHFIEVINKPGIRGIIAKSLMWLLLVGLTGNIYTTFFAAITGPEYAKKMSIYRASEKAITQARARKIPILIAPGIAYPYDKTRNLPYNNTVPGDWVLKTLPAFKVHDQVPVYAIDTLADVDKYLQQLPAGVTEVMVGDGVRYGVREERQ